MNAVIAALVAVALAALGMQLPPEPSCSKTEENVCRGAY